MLFAYIARNSDAFSSRGGVEGGGDDDEADDDDDSKHFDHQAAHRFSC